MVGGSPVEVIGVKRLIDHPGIGPITPGSHHGGGDIAWSRPHRDADWCVSIHRVLGCAKHAPIPSRTIGEWLVQAPGRCFSRLGEAGWLDAIRAGTRSLSSLCLP